MRRLTIVMTAIVVLSTVVHAQKKDGVVVMPLKSKAITKTALAAINDLVVFSMTQKSTYKVVTKDDLDAELGREGMKDLMGCDAVKCAAEIGGALGTRFLLAGSVRKLGSNIMVNLSLIDTNKRETKRGQAMVKNNEDLYPQAVNTAVHQILGLTGPATSPPAVRPATAPPPRTATPQQPTTSGTRVDEVQQPGTNLFWLRCPLGQKWDGSSCQGKGTQESWDAAMTACSAGYRLPAREEFTALLRGCDSKVTSSAVGKCNSCAKSRACSSMFGSNKGWFWSSSYANYPTSAWHVTFNGDYFLNYDKSNTDHVRCVRLGP